VNWREGARSGEWAQHFSNAFCFTKSVAMATSLEISKKDVQIDHLHAKCFHLV